MEQQGWLPGFENLRSLDKLFFAILAPPDPARQLATVTMRLQHQHRLRGLPRPRPHISLHGVCECEGLPKASVTAAREAGGLVVLPAFDIILDRAMSFAGQGLTRPLVLCPGDEIPALMALHHALGEAMARAGLGPQASSVFTPHLTLLYDETTVPKRTIETVRWRVRDFVLVHSLVNRSRYIQLARWPLHG
jgi:2'-5' RNA ligase